MKKKIYALSLSCLQLFSPDPLRREMPLLRRPTLSRLLIPDDLAPLASEVQHLQMALLSLAFPWLFVDMLEQLWNHEILPKSKSFSISIMSPQLLHYDPRNFPKQAAPCNSPGNKTSLLTTNEIPNKKPLLALCV